MKPFLLSLLSIEITEAQLLISGLASGIAIVGVVVRWLVTSPEREAAAYKQGVTDEKIRCQQDIDELRQRDVDRVLENTKLRNALLKLAIASDLTVSQRAEIAEALGFPRVSKLDDILNLPPEDKAGDN